MFVLLFTDPTSDAQKLLSTIDDNISVVKLSPTMRKRGQPKGAGLTVIGLPKKERLFLLGLHRGGTEIVSDTAQVHYATRILFNTYITDTVIMLLMLWFSKYSYAFTVK